MLCEKYKPALIEAAATGAEPAPAIREHVESCAHCAAELAHQRSLVAAIDANLHRQMNAPVPAAMLQRFEARLAQQTPSRSRNLSWLYASVALATTAAVILFALPRVRQHKSNDRTAAIPQAVQSASDHRPQIAPLGLQPATPAEIRRDRSQHARTAPRPEPEVLVPHDQELLLAAYAQKLRDQKFVLQASLVGLDPIEPSTIATTEIRNLEIKPLPDLNTK